MSKNTRQYSDSPRAVYMRDWLAKRKAEGGCQRCSNPADPGFVTCGECRRKKYERDLADVKKKQHSGKCGKCINRPAVQGKTLCSECLEKASDQGKRRFHRRKQAGLCPQC